MMMISYYFISYKIWWVVNMVGQIFVRVVEFGGYYIQVDFVKCFIRIGFIFYGLQGVISRQWLRGNFEFRFFKI